jgi:hypothetical protein
MPTPDCWETIGHLKADIEVLKENDKVKDARIKALESDRIRLVTVGGVVAFLLTGVGAFFADPIRKLFLGIFSN